MWTDNGQAVLNMNFIQIHRGHKNRQRATGPLESVLKIYFLYN